MNASTESHRQAYARLDALQRAGARIRINEALHAFGAEPTAEQMQDIVGAAIRHEVEGKPLPGRLMPVGFDEIARA